MQGVTCVFLGFEDATGQYRYNARGLVPERLLSFVDLELVGEGFSIDYISSDLH